MPAPRMPLSPYLPGMDHRAPARPARPSPVLRAERRTEVRVLSRIDRDEDGRPRRAYGGGLETVEGNAAPPATLAARISDSFRANLVRYLTGEIPAEPAGSAEESAPRRAAQELRRKATAG